MQLRSIEIDLDIHKLIEAHRCAFDEPSYLVLRRLLALGPPALATQSPSAAEVGKRGWRSGSVSLPHGTQLKMTYNGETSFGQVEDGWWVIGNEKFDSPSGAACSTARTRQGHRTHLDGWKYWYVKRPTDSGWILIDELRVPSDDELVA
jgi:hypothetical protein